MIGKTEAIPEAANPQFVKSFIIQANVEKDVVNLKFDVFDVDDFDNTNDIQAHDLIGSTECEFHDILSSPEQTL